MHARWIPESSQTDNMHCMSSRQSLHWHSERTSCCEWKQLRTSWKHQLNPMSSRLWMQQLSYSESNLSMGSISWRHILHEVSKILIISCPAGKFCTHIRGDAPRDCQEGTYSPVGYMECIPCPPGKECSVDGTTITTCDAGKYSFETEYSCTWGRPNYYTPLITSSISAPCPPGSYQDTDRNTCRPCPANQSCLLTNSAKLLSDYTPAGSTADACSGSTFSLAGDGFCRDNLPGMDGTNICALGTYSEGSSCVAC